MDNIFKKGQLLALISHKNGSNWFVVAVTGNSKDPESFKGIVVACGKKSPWEIGHKSKNWTKDAELWDIVEIPQSLLTKPE